MRDLFGYLVPRVAPGDLEIISRPVDFMGVNYYTRALVEYDADSPLQVRQLHPEGEYTAMDWEGFPQGLTDLLVRLDRDYDGVDLYVTENGCAYEDVVEDGAVHDAKRSEYLRLHFAAAHQAIAEGASLRGYFVWSFMDNFEWAYGYSRRFGLTYVDYETQQRILKDSAKYFAGVVDGNAVDA
jgi:beta-glucosidase